MMTQFLRVLFLAVLVLTAHWVRPFSLNNLASFSWRTCQAWAAILPDKALGKAEQMGWLAAIVGKHLSPMWLRNNWAPVAPQEIALLAPAQPKATAGYLRSRGLKRERVVNSSRRPLQAKELAAKVLFGGAPLPFVPGIETGFDFPVPAIVAAPNRPRQQAKPDCEQELILPPPDAPADGLEPSEKSPLTKLRIIHLPLRLGLRSQPVAAKQVCVVSPPLWPGDKQC
jgi:hypothetical protein